MGHRIVDENAARLRRRAEAKLVARAGTVPVLNAMDTQRLLHELQVHQIALEMQSDELRQAAKLEVALQVANSRNAELEMQLAACTAELLAARNAGTVSAPAQERTFWLTACQEKGEMVDTAKPASVPESAEKILRRHYGGSCVLLVEDDPINREVAQMLLEEAGLETEIAENGRRALQLVERNDYALILMDMQMPEMGGIEATQAIRKLPGRQSIPIVALTANALASEREDCLAAGMNDFITKPVDPEHLFEILLKWLSRPQDLTSPVD